MCAMCTCISLCRFLQGTCKLLYKGVKCWALSLHIKNMQVTQASMRYDVLENCWQHVEICDSVLTITKKEIGDRKSNQETVTYCIC